MMMYFLNQYHSKEGRKVCLKRCLAIRRTDQSRTNGPINAHLTIAQVMPRYNHNNEKQEALL